VQGLTLFLYPFRKPAAQPSPVASAR
jgi:hypothetical protein